MSDWFQRFGYAEVDAGLLAGAQPRDADDVARLSGEGVEIVYNLCEDSEYAEDSRKAVERALDDAFLDEIRLPLPDYGGLPASMLDRAVGEILAELGAGRRVYVHCRAGWQRSAAVAAAVIAARDDMDVERALEVVRDRKPTAEPLEHQVDDLLSWWRRR